MRSAETGPGRRAALPLAAAALLFALSGAGALVVETVWMRWLRGLLGATAPAASATLVAFFAGHALGAAWGARRAPSWARPLRAWGGLELGAAAAAAAVPALLALGEALLGPVYDGLRRAPAALTAVRFGIALAATLPAAALGGATLPTVGAAVLGAVRRLGPRGAAFYGVNTLGAAAGAGLAAFALPEWLGVPATYALGVGAIAAAGLGALALAARHAGAPAEPAEATEAVRRTAARPAPARARRHARGEAGRRIGPRGLGALALLSGFGSFAAQILFVQAFARVLDQSVYAFGTVLVVVLLALAAGALGVAALERRRPVDPRRLLALALLATALALLAFPAAFSAATGGLAYRGEGVGWPGLWLRALGLAAGTAGPVLLAAAVVFPAVLAEAGRGPEAGAHPGARLGALAALDTAGAIAGALVAPFLLLPALGLWPAFAALAALHAAAALALPAPGRSLGRGPRALVLAAGAAALLVVASPFDLPPVRVEPQARLVAAETTAAGVVAVVERRGERLLQIDNHYALGGTGDAARQERQGHLPLLLHPEARRVAHVGSATGSSAGTALAHPVERLHLVELVPAVARAAARHFEAVNRAVYRDPRSEVVLDDARNFFRLTGRRFDAVVGDLFVPWRSGTAALYSREHFAAVRSRLAPDGLFCQWLPLYQLSLRELRIVTATFLDVFPRAALFRGDFLGRHPIAALVGWKGEVAPAARVMRAARRLARLGEGGRWLSHPTGLWSLYVAPLAPSAPALRDVPRQSESRPLLQYLAARSHGGRAGASPPATGLRWTDFAEAARRRALRSGALLYPDLPPEARRAARGGALLQRAGALYVAGRRDAAARAFTAAARALPPDLVTDAPPDPTAAELWHTHTPTPEATEAPH